jgi:hypothetical protein
VYRSLLSAWCCLSRLRSQPAPSKFLRNGIFHPKIFFAYDKHVPSHGLRTDRTHDRTDKSKTRARPNSGGRRIFHRSPPPSQTHTVRPLRRRRPHDKQLRQRPGYVEANRRMARRYHAGTELAPHNQPAIILKGSKPEDRTKSKSSEPRYRVSKNARVGRSCRHPRHQSPQR